MLLLFGLCSKLKYPSKFCPSVSILLDADTYCLPSNNQLPVNKGWCCSAGDSLFEGTNENYQHITHHVPAPYDAPE